MSNGFAYRSAVELKAAITAKEISPVEVTQAALGRQEALQETLNSFATPTPDLALAAAKEAEKKIMAGEDSGLLAGLPLSVKDVLPVKDVQLNLGSKAFADNIAGIDAPPVERIKAQGGAIIGKTTTSELGCKAVGDCPLTGITRNPWNTDKTPGGSSAGAAASIAAGITPFGICTDGGGSVRIPCSLSGLFGIKPQFARVPMFPASAAPTLGHVGSVARTVRDAALLLTVIAGPDRRDPFSVAEPTPDFLGACEQSIKGMRIAWSPTFGYAQPNAEVAEICEKAAKVFEGLGCSVETVENVMDEDPGVMWTSEFYAGIGTRLKPVLEANAEILDPVVVDILSNALDQSLESYYSNVFKRYEFREKMRSFFDDYDLLLSPTLPVYAFDVGLDQPKGLPDDRNAVSWVYYTYPFNLTGQPAASIPAGFSGDGLPVGLQMVSRINSEVDIFRAAAAFEAAQPWADRTPLD